MCHVLPVVCREFSVRREYIQVFVDAVVYLLIDCFSWGGSLMHRCLDWIVLVFGSRRGGDAQVAGA